MAKTVKRDRLAAVGARARAAEARGDDARAGEEWRCYRLIKDAARDPDELLIEGIALACRRPSLRPPLGDRLRPYSPDRVGHHLRAVLGRRCDSVENVPTQRVPVRKTGVVEIVVRTVDHPDSIHNCAGAHVWGGRK